MKSCLYSHGLGGGFRLGISEMEFDGERIARRGVVVVTVNYRLNTFGFHPEITAEAPEAPQISVCLTSRRLRWVKGILPHSADPAILQQEASLQAAAAYCAI